MYASSIIAFAFAGFAATTLALPQSGGSGGKSTNVPTITIKQAQEQCNGNNNGQSQVSCCNGKEGGGLLDLLSGANVLGGDCSQISVPIGILSKQDITNVNEYCSNRVACCPAGTEVTIPFRLTWPSSTSSATVY